MRKQNRNRLIDKENKFLVAKCEMQGGIKQEYGVKEYKILCIKQIGNKDLLFQHRELDPLSCNNL